MVNGKRKSGKRVILTFIVLLAASIAYFVHYRKTLFTKEKWRNCGENFGSYNRCPGRENTIDDLTANYHLQRRTYQNLLTLLGPYDIRHFNQQRSELQIEYEIVTESISDIDPDHSQYLVFIFTSRNGKINPHQRVKHWYVKEWKSD